MACILSCFSGSKNESLLYFLVINVFTTLVSISFIVFLVDIMNADFTFRTLLVLLTLMGRIIVLLEILHCIPYSRGYQISYYKVVNEVDNQHDEYEPEGSGQ